MFFNAPGLLGLLMIASISALPTDLDTFSSDGVMSFDLFRRDSNARSSSKTLEASISNAHYQVGAGGYYFIEVKIGTPLQSLQLVLDTGSSDFWVYGSELCSPPSGEPSVSPRCFNESLSTTAKSTNLPKFVGKYGGGGGSNSDTNGTYITDTVSIGGSSLEDVTLAVVETGTKLESAGILGLSYDFNENNQVGTGVKYPNVLDVLYNRGHIKSHTYSLYLNDLDSPSGSILFGGYDTEKFDGPLVPLPIYSNGLPPGLSVGLLGVSITNASGLTQTIGFYPESIPATLDSGTPVTAGLPNVTYMAIVKHIESLGFNVTGVETANPVVDCGLSGASGSVDLTFTDPTSSGDVFNVTIAVPLSELVIPETVNGKLQGCLLGINNKVGGGILFGDPFMRSMYIVYDFDNNVIALAQSKFGSSSSNVVPIGKPPRAGGKLWYNQTDL